MTTSIASPYISVEPADLLSVDARQQDLAANSIAALEAATPRVSRSMSVTANAGIAMRASRSKKTVRDVLERLKWQRIQAQLRRDLWLQYADPIAAGDKADAISDTQQKLEAAEHQLSQLPQIAWCDRATRIRLPALCGSRPYFPAAP